MKLTGGFNFLESGETYETFTLSGRHSLRLVLESIASVCDTIFLPSFICDLVPQEIKSFGFKFQIYHVDEKFEAELPDLGPNDFIYVTRYFGHESQFIQTVINSEDLNLIFDDVFEVYMPSFKCKKWFYFNSLRKITGILASYFCSSERFKVNIKETLDDYNKYAFSAQRLKENLITSCEYTSNEHLLYHQKAEEILDECKEVRMPSDKQVAKIYYFLTQLNSIQENRRQNLNIVKSELGTFGVPSFHAKFPSYYPIFLENRDFVRSWMQKHNVYLPVHWPNGRFSKSNLANRIISIPLSETSGLIEVNEMVSLLKECLQNDR